MKLETDIIHCQKLNLFDGNRGLNCFARRQFNVEPIVDIRQTQPLPNYSAVAYIRGSSCVFLQYSTIFYNIVYFYSAVAYIRESSYVYFYIIGLFSKLSSSTRLVPENATI